MLVYESQNANKETFLNAADRIQGLDATPDKQELLLLYGLYKQAIHGNNTTPKPFIVDIKANYKWNAWSSQRKKPKRVAEQEYIELVDTLMRKYQ